LPGLRTYPIVRGVSPATKPEKLIYWEVANDLGITPEPDTEPLPLPTFADLWERYPLTSYRESDMIVTFDPPARVDTAFMDRVSRPVGIFNQVPTEHTPTGPNLAQCVCGETWPCTKAGKSLSREVVPLRPVEPEWPEFGAASSAD
jgi:hypothetical protein